MEHSELQTALETEGKSFAAKYPTLAGDKEFISNIARAFNGRDLDTQLIQHSTSEGKLPSAAAVQEKMGGLTPFGAGRHLAIMHGYLEKAYIDGFGDATDPEWSHTRVGSWNRWVKYLQFVECYPRDYAINFAKRFFYAVDSIEAYS